MATQKKDKDKGLRYNSNKTRHELIEPFATEQKARIFTKGAVKYEDHNWIKGMKWSKMLASAKRHINAFERGEDYDFYPETCEGCRNGTCENHTGELHSAQAAWNMDGLTSFYKFYPQGDDRLHNILPKPKIGLDVDEVICDWVGPWCKLHNIPIPSSWYFQWDIQAIFKDMREKGILDSFYAGLPPKLNPDELPFEPVCYISHRPIDSSITKTWLERHGFPLKPVFHVDNRMDKIKICQDQGVDIFVDDSYDTFQAMNLAGVCCYLFDAKHNRRYNVGYRRIKSLKDLPIW